METAKTIVGTQVLIFIYKVKTDQLNHKKGHAMLTIPDRSCLCMNFKLSLAHFVLKTAVPQQTIIGEDKAIAT